MSRPVPGAASSPGAPASRVASGRRASRPRRSRSSTSFPGWGRSPRRRSSTTEPSTAVRVGRRPRRGPRHRPDADRAAARPRDPVRSAVELHWPALLAGGLRRACALDLGLGAAGRGGGARAVRSRRRAPARRRRAARGSRRRARRPRPRVGLASHRRARTSALVGEIGESGAAELVTVAPARTSEWSTRVIAVTRAFRHEASASVCCSSCRSGARRRAEPSWRRSVRIAEPRPEEDGFDERAWLARQGIHVVLEASSWRQVGRRGGLAGFGDGLRDRIERAVTRGADGTRRGIVLGVVLGEDEGLPADVQDDFRASGLYHLLAVSGQNVAFLAGGIYALGWLLRLSRPVRELVDPRCDRVLRPRRRLAAVGRARRRRGRARIARLARRPAERPLALPGGRRVRAHGVDADVPPRARLPALVRRRRGDLRRAAPRATVSRRLPGSDRRRRRGLGRARMRPRRRRRSCCSSSARRRSTRSPRTSSRSSPRRSCSGSGSSRRSSSPCRPARPRVSPGSPAGPPPGSSSSRASSPLFRARRSARGRCAAVARRRRGDVARRSTAAPAGVARAACSSRSRSAVSSSSRRRRGSPRTHRDVDPPSGLRVTFLDVGQGDAVLLETPRARVLVDQGPPEATSQDSSSHRRSVALRRRPHPSAARPRGRGGGRHSPTRRRTGARPGSRGVRARERGGASRREQRASPYASFAPAATFRAGGLVLRALWPADAGTPSEDPNLNAVVLVASYGETDVFLPADAESDVTAVVSASRRSRSSRSRTTAPRTRASPSCASYVRASRSSPAAGTTVRASAARDRRGARERTGARDVPNRPGRPRRRGVRRPA